MFISGVVLMPIWKLEFRKSDKTPMIRNWSFITVGCTLFLSPDVIFETDCNNRQRDERRLLKAKKKESCVVLQMTEISSRHYSPALEGFLPAAVFMYEWMPAQVQQPLLC